MNNVVENVEPAVLADMVVEHMPEGHPAPEVPKVDRRKGKRRVDNPDGTRSYGFKADGTPRKKPGRPGKSPAGNVA